MARAGGRADDVAHVDLLDRHHHLQQGGRAGRNLKSKSAKGGSHNGATCPTVKQRVGIHCGKNRPLEPNSSLFRSWESKVQQCPRTDGAQPTVYHKAYALVPLPRVGA